MVRPLSPATFASSGPIDLKIVGDVPALYELSRSMSTVHDRLDDVAGRLAIIPQNMASFWEGESLESFTYAAKQHADAIKVVAAFAKDASSVTDAYGGLIERGRNQFADYADAARAANLTVADARYIHPPVAPRREVCQTDGSDQKAISAYEDQSKLFREIRDLVATWRSDLEKWINDYFGPLLGRLEELNAVEELIKHLRDAGLSTFDALAGESDSRISKDLSHFLDKQKEYEERWQEHKEDRRSGDPARQERGERYDEDAHRKARDGIDAEIKKLGVTDFLTKGGKAAGLLGGLAAAAYDIYDGESPSKVAAGAVGSAVGGATGAAAGAAAGAVAGAIGGTVVPGIGNFVGGAAGAAFGALGGYYGSDLGEDAWENGVSLRTRQAIDEGLAGKYHLSTTTDPRTRYQVEAHGSFR